MLSDFCLQKEHAVSRIMVEGNPNNTALEGEVQSNCPHCLQRNPGPRNKKPHTARMPMVSCTGLLLGATLGIIVLFVFLEKGKDFLVGPTLCFVKYY